MTHRELLILTTAVAWATPGVSIGRALEDGKYVIQFVDEQIEEEARKSRESHRLEREAKAKEKAEAEKKP